MCLYPMGGKARGTKTRTRAWKVVNADRSPRIYGFATPLKYRKGSVHKVDLAKILRHARRTGNYGPGIHVYRTRRRAASSKYYDELLIEVRVDPKDWVADGISEDAVYTKVKVVT